MSFVQMLVLLILVVVPSIVSIYVLSCTQIGRPTLLFI